MLICKPTLSRLLCLALCYEPNCVFDGRRFCNGNVDALPHPAISWPTFASALKDLIRQHDKVFCPITQSMRPWVDLSALYKTFAKEIKNNQSGSGASCVVC